MIIPKLASKIDLSNQELTEIPEAVFACKNLKKLNLSNNKIKVLPIELSKLKYLKNLDISNNEISVLYAKNFAFQNLEILILRNNKLKAIPKQITGLTKLRKCCIGGNFLKNLPEGFGNLQTLESLDIADNDFTEFPTSILQLTNLKTLWLNNNQFEDFPTGEIKQRLQNLRALYTFSPINNSTSSVNSDYKTLQSHRGNSVAQLNLLSLKGKSKSANTLKKSTMPDTSTKSKRNSIFISYCHADDTWLKKLNTVLKTMEFEGHDFERWDDTRLKTGDIWKKEIETAIERANVAILLISNDFLASKFIQEKEVPELLHKAKEEGAKILPVIVGRCRFTQSVLKEFQSVNNPERPLKAVESHEVDEIFYKLSTEIDDILNA